MVIRTTSATRALLVILAASVAGSVGCGDSGPKKDGNTNTGTTPTATAGGPVVRVIDGYTDEPIAGATVTASDANGPIGTPVTSDADGLATAPAGTVTACASLPAYRGDCRGILAGRTRVTIPLHDPAVESPEYGGGPERTRATPALDLPVPDGEPRWQYRGKALLEFPPAVARGTVVLTTNRGRVIAFDASSGDIRWQQRHTTRSYIASSPAIDIDGNAAIVSGMDGRLVSYDLTRGQIRWEYPVGDSSIESSPLIIGQTVYIGAWNGRLYAVSTDKGRLRWSYPAADDIKGSAAKSGDNVVFADYSGYVYAVNAATGDPVWKVRAGKRFYGGPGVSNGVVVIGDVGGAVVGLDATDGHQLWRHPTGDFVYSSPAIANGTVYIGSYSHTFEALDLKTGKRKWSRDLGERISGSATVVGDVVYVSVLARPGAPDRTYGLDVKSGDTKWQGEDGRYSPAVATGRTLYIVGRTTMYAYRAP